MEAAALTDLTTASIGFKFNVASIYTRNGERNNHFKSAEFFDVENNSSIKGVTKPVTFDVECRGLWI
ncbi:YceI family protein [Oceanobacillus saliphilus]|uniref:YceI family protein n=1 Tax=Oceanobacillus saliphilus TaxID=2925834 RepID=UPI0027D34FD3|nr:YceI family protein [Oceanobacillus saliphilus]